MSKLLLQALLGDTLGELEYMRANQVLGHKALKILQRRASLAVLRARASSSTGLIPSQVPKFSRSK